MSRMVNDHRLPTIDNLKKLQNEGIDLNWLINGEKSFIPRDNINPDEIIKNHIYEGPEYVETVISTRASYPDQINMQSNDVYTIRVNSEMMHPTIKINDAINAIKVDKVIEEGLYASINEIEGKKILWLKRIFLSPDRKKLILKSDNTYYPDFTVDRELIDSNQLNLRVFSILLTIDKISP